MGVHCGQSWTLPYNETIASQASSWSKCTCTGIPCLALSNTKLLLLCAPTQTCYPRPFFCPSSSYKDCLALMLSECLLGIYQSCNLVPCFLIRLSITWNMVSYSSGWCQYIIYTASVKVTQCKHIWGEGISPENIPSWNGLYNGLLGAPLCNDKYERVETSVSGFHLWDMVCMVQ